MHRFYCCRCSRGWSAANHRVDARTPGPDSGLHDAGREICAGSEILPYMKILTIVGARPQFVKAAVVSPAIRENDNRSEVMLHAGQHFDADMSAIFFNELGIPEPAHHLHIHGGSHGDMTGRMLAALEPVLMTERPHWVVVFGDTNSTLAGALAAAKLNIPIAHVEAGLRSYNRSMREEVNRRVTQRCSCFSF